MFRILTEKEQLRRERAERLKQQNEQKKSEELMLEQLVDVDFRQSMVELGVK